MVPLGGRGLCWWGAGVAWGFRLCLAWWPSEMACLCWWCGGLAGLDETRAGMDRRLGFTLAMARLRVPTAIRKALVIVGLVVQLAGLSSVHRVIHSAKVDDRSPGSGGRRNRSAASTGPVRGAALPRSGERGRPIASRPGGRRLKTGGVRTRRLGTPRP